MKVGDLYFNKERIFLLHESGNLIGLTNFIWPGAMFMFLGDKETWQKHLYYRVLIIDPGVLGNQELTHTTVLLHKSEYAANDNVRKIQSFKTPEDVNDREKLIQNLLRKPFQ